MSQADDDFWKGQVVAARRNQLEVIRKAATGWAALFTAVLGVFGSVTFVGGLSGLNDLADPLATNLRWAILVAALLTLAATLLTGFVANSIPRVTSDLDAGTLRDDTKNKARRGRKLLRASMYCAAAAGVIVTIGSAVALFAEKKSSASEAPTVVAVVDGMATCGALTADDRGVASVSGTPLDDGVESLTVVDACPAKG